jgi:hypothetical protein
MRTFLRGKVTLLFMTLGLLLAVPTIALADIVVADGDFITTGNQAGTSANPIDIGKVKAGGSVERQVSFQLQCNGSRHVDQNQTVTLDATPGTTGVPAGGSLTATAATIGPIPSSWPDDTSGPSNCGTTPPTPIDDNGNTTVKFTAPSNAANGAVYNFSVTWGGADVTVSPSGGSDSNAVTGSTQVFFRVTVDAQAPDTTIDTGPSGTVNSNSATFTFSSNEANSTFETRLDNGAWESNGTSTSKTYNSLSDASHTFDVRATDAVGNTDASPARRTWTVQTDSTPPVITPNVVGTLGDNGWYTSDVSVSWTVTDPESAVTSKSASCDATTNINSDTAGQTVSCTATSAGGTDTKSVTIKRDATPPQINDDGTTQSPNGAGWFKAAVVNDFSASDATSGLADSGDANFSKSSGTAEGNAVKINSGPVSDKAGNTNPGIDSAAFKIDLTKPSVSVTGVSNGATYTTGDVPTPDCNTTDGLSGVKEHASVNVTGGTGGFGTLTATCSGAVDNAENAGDPKSVTYSVKAAFNGFLQPIDGHSVNTGKFGRTYPIKWQLRDSSGALISDSAAQLLVGTMTGGQKAASCTSFDLTDTDALEESTTGNTALRYDATSDQFIYNYKAPTSGTCYVFAIRNADGLTTQQIDFKFTK